MPPSASSNLPRRSATAPVNAPRTWPNSSLSISSSGIAAQFTSTNGRRAARLDRVDRPRDQFLAGAVLAVDQHAAVGRRRHRHLLAQLAHRVALAHHRLRAIDARAQRAILGLEPALPQRVADDEHGLVERERLLDEVEGAHLDRPTADSMLPCPEISTTCASTCRSRSRASVARPSMPGSQTSSTIRSTGLRVSRSRHASPLDTASTL